MSLALLTPDGYRGAGAKSSPLPAGIASRKGPSAGSIELISLNPTAVTYEAMVRSQPWIYAAVQKLTKGTSRLPLKVYEYLDDEGNRKRTRGHPLAQLLARPYPRASTMTWVASVAWNMAVHGNALLAKSRAEGPGSPVTELWPVPWRHIEVIHDHRNFPMAYMFHGSSGSLVPLAPEDVVHFQWMSPNGVTGVSPMEPLARTLALEDAAQEWAANYLRNAATPSGVFTTPKKLDDRSIPRLRHELDRLYGGVENAGRFGIFDQDLEWHAISASPVDAALVQQRKLNREEVCGVYDIAPPLLSILERATFNNITELHKALYVDTLGPRLTLKEQTLQAQLIDDEPTFEGTFVEFDFGALVRPDVTARAQAYRQLLEAGYTLNELRRLDNLPPIDDPRADIPHVPLNIAPLDATDEQLGTRARLASAVPASPAPAAQDPTGDTPSTIEIEE